MADKRRIVSLEDLDGVIIKNRVGYSLNKLGVKKSITKVGLLKLIENMDVEKHNAEYLDKLKEQLQTFDEEGYNALGFAENGIHRNGTEFSDKGYNSKGWINVEYHSTSLTGEKLGDRIHPLNAFTGTKIDLDERDKDGYDKDGFNLQGLDRENYGRDGYNEKGFNREKIHRDTGTEYNPEGYNEAGMDKDGYNIEGINSKGKTHEDVENEQQQQRKNFLGLIALAEGYSKSQISTEEYLKKHKISLEELIDFAKKQGMKSDVIVGLHKKKAEYSKYTKSFSKNEYFKNKTTINGVEITEEIVDKVLNHLNSNDRLVCQKTVQDSLIQYTRGELNLENGENEEKERKTENKASILPSAIEATEAAVVTDKMKRAGDTLENIEQTQEKKGEAYGDN